MVLVVEEEEKHVHHYSRVVVCRKKEVTVKWQSSRRVVAKKWTRNTKKSKKKYLLEQQKKKKYYLRTQKNMLLKLKWAADLNVFSAILVKKWYLKMIMSGVNTINEAPSTSRSATDFSIAAIMASGDSCSREPSERSNSKFHIFFYSQLPSAYQILLTSTSFGRKLSRSRRWCWRVQWCRGVANS